MQNISLPQQSRSRCVQSGIIQQRIKPPITPWITGLAAVVVLTGPTLCDLPALAVDDLDSNFRLSAGSSEYGPVVSLVQPGYNDLLRGVTPVVIAVQNRRYPAKTVEMFVDDQLATPVGGVPMNASPSAQFNWDTSRYVDGPHRLSVRVTDTQGFIGVAEVTVFISNNAAADTEAPELAWLGVKSGDILRGQQNLRLAVSDNFGVKMLIVQLNKRDAPDSTDAIHGWFMNRPPYVVKLDTTQFPDDVYVLNAKAYDVLENDGHAPPLYVGFNNYTISPTKMQDELMKLAGRIGVGPAGKVPPVKNVVVPPVKKQPVIDPIQNPPGTTQVDTASDTLQTSSRIAMAPRAFEAGVDRITKVMPRASAPAATARLLPENQPKTAPQPGATKQRTSSLPVATAPPAGTTHNPTVAPRPERVIKTSPDHRRIVASGTPQLDNTHSRLSGETRIASATQWSEFLPSRSTVPVASRPAGNARRLAAPQVSNAATPPHIDLSPKTPSGETRIASASPLLGPASLRSNAALTSRPSSHVRPAASLPGLSSVADKTATPSGEPARLSSSEALTPSTRIALAELPGTLSSTPRTVAPRFSEPAQRLQAQIIAPSGSPYVSALPVGRSAENTRISLIPPSVQNAEPAKVASLSTRPWTEKISMPQNHSNAQLVGSAQASARSATVPATRIAAADVNSHAVITSAPTPARSTPAQVTRPMAALPALPQNRHSSSTPSITVAPGPQWVARNGNLPKSYVAQRDEALATVAARFKLPVALLASANNVRPDARLTKGTELQLPQQLVVTMDDKPVTGDVGSMLVGSTAVTPFRFLFEEQGGKMDWNSAQQRVTASRGDLQVTLTIGSSTAMVNQKEVMMDLAAFLLSGRTMVPVRFFEDALHAEVEWEPSTGRLYIAMASPGK